MDHFQASLSVLAKFRCLYPVRMKSLGRHRARPPLRTPHRLSYRHKKTKGVKYGANKIFDFDYFDLPYVLKLRRFFFLRRILRCRITTVFFGHANLFGLDVEESWLAVAFVLENILMEKFDR